MAATPTTPAASVAALPPGTLVEVKGTLRCTTPFNAEFSGVRCVYFKAETIQEDTEYSTDSDGKKRQRTNSRTIHKNIQHAACAIEDASGSIAVDLKGAEIEGVEVVPRVENAASLGADVAGMIAGIGRDNTAFRHKETILPPDISIYVLGEVQPGGTIGAAAKGSANKTFVVSHKSEEERAERLAWSTSNTLILVGVPAAAAALLAWWAWTIAR